MKKILIVLLLVSGSALGQSQIEKYNSILERYEYYEGNTLVGFKEYNDILDQWEYTDVTKQDDLKSKPYSSPYRHLEPIDTYDETSVYQALSAKEARYENNVAQIRELINDLTSKLEGFSDLEKRKMAYNRWKRVIEVFNKENEVLDYSSTSIAQSVMNYFTEQFNIIVENVSKNSGSNSTSSSINESVGSRTLGESNGVDLLTSNSFKGGYKTFELSESAKNSKTGEWEKKEVERVETQFYFSEKAIFWKRGDGAWNFHEWQYKNYKPETEVHFIGDRLGNMYLIDNDVSYILIYSNKKEEGWMKAEQFYTLRRDDSVKKPF